MGSEAARVLDLGDLLSASPGIHVRSAGGTGAFQSLRLRGASGAEVRVLIDGVPVAQGGSGGVDLSSLPLDNVQEIEVFRGNLPIGLGGEGIGGAINLVTRRPDGGRDLALNASAGSFGTAEASLFAQLAKEAWNISLFSSGYRAANDYPYYDDNGTPYTTADDQASATRQNADTRRADASLRVRHKAPSTWNLAMDAITREGGVPGSGAVPATGARFDEQGLNGGLRWESGGGDLCRGGGGLSVGWRGLGYRDPRGLVGLGSPELLSQDASAGLDGTLRVKPHQKIEFGASTRLDRSDWESRDLVTPGIPARRWREHAMFGAFVGLSASKLLSPTLHDPVLGAQLLTDLTSSGAVGALPGSLGAVEETPSNELWSPSLSGSLGLGESLRLRASAGLAHRLPTFAELYGAGGTMVGNPELLPERGSSQDLGLDLAGGLLDGAGSLSLTLFHRRVEDLIATVQNSQLTLRTENFGEVALWGAESEASWAGPLPLLRRAELRLAGTWLRSEVLSGDPLTLGHSLPGQPLLDLRVDADMGPERLRGGLSVEADSGNFRDSANLYEIPARAFLHLRLSALPLPREKNGPKVTFEVRNVLDHRVEYIPEIPLIGSGEPAPQAVSDYWGYPLPGRAFYFSLAWKS